MKAKPAIEAVESVIKSITTAEAGQESKVSKVKKNTKTLNPPQAKPSTFNVILLSPSKDFFTQKQAHTLSNSDHIIFVCTRYEGIDYRFQQYMKKKYGKQFHKISIGQYITLGGEVPAMVMIEAITRLIP